MAKKIDDDIMAAFTAKGSAPPAGSQAAAPVPAGVQPDVADAFASADEARKVAGTSKLKSLWEGIKSGATLNFGDELAGTAAAIGGKVGAIGSGVEPSFQPDFSQNYRTARDDAREEQRIAAKANPKTNFLGNVVGGALLTPLVPGFAPLKAAEGASKAVRAVRYLAPLMATGSAMGAVSGAGGAQELADVPYEIGKGAVLGAGGGLAGGAIGAGVGKLLGPLLGNRLRDTAAKADELRVLTASGAHGGGLGPPPVLKEALKVPGGVAETARVMRTAGMAPSAWTLGLGTTGMVQRAANATNNQAHEVIKAVVAGVDEAGVKVDIKAFANQMRAQAKVLAERPELDDAAELLAHKASLYEARFPDGVTMKHAQKLVSDFGDRVNWTKAATGQLIPNANVASLEATRAMREAMDTAAETAFKNAGVPELAAKATRIFGDAPPTNALDVYRGARRAWQVSKIVGDAAETSTNRAAKNNKLGLMDTQVGQLAAAAVPGAPGIAAAAAIGARKLAGSVSATARATSAEKVRSILSYLDQNPTALKYVGDAGQLLLQAAQSGGKHAARAWTARELADLEADPGYAELAKRAAASGR